MILRGDASGQAGPKRFLLFTFRENRYHQFYAQFDPAGKSVNLFYIVGLGIEVLQLLKPLAIVQRHLLHEVPFFILNLAANLLAFLVVSGATFPWGYTSIIQVV